MIGALMGGAVVDAVGTALDKLFTSDEERANKDIIMERLRQQPELLQIELNKVEAASPHWFVAAWRPGLAWTIIVGFAYTFWGYDLLTWLTTMTNLGAVAQPPRPNYDFFENIAFPTIMGLLGFGGMRTYEKVKGVTR